MSREDELRDVLRETAKEIAGSQSNPRTWLSWMVYLLARLEEQATSQNPDMASFIDMLSALQDAIRNRVRTGGWN
jgi:hypothetical protein